MRYALIRRHGGTWPIVVQCRVLQVSASGYRHHRLQQATDIGPNQPHRLLSDAALAVHIKAGFARMKNDLTFSVVRTFSTLRGIN